MSEELILFYSFLINLTMLIIIEVVKVAISKSACKISIKTIDYKSEADLCDQHPIDI